MKATVRFTESDYRVLASQLANGAVRDEERVVDAYIKSGDYMLTVRAEVRSGDYYSFYMVSWSEVDMTEEGGRYEVDLENDTEAGERISNFDWCKMARSYGDLMQEIYG